MCCNLCHRLWSTIQRSTSVPTTSCKYTCAVISVAGLDPQSPHEGPAARGSHRRSVRHQPPQHQPASGLRSHWPPWRCLWKGDPRGRHGNQPHGLRCGQEHRPLLQGCEFCRYFSYCLYGVDKNTDLFYKDVSSVDIFLIVCIVQTRTQTSFTRMWVL